MEAAALMAARVALPRAATSAMLAFPKNRSSLRVITHRMLANHDPHLLGDIKRLLGDNKRSHVQVPRQWID